MTANETNIGVDSNKDEVLIPPANVQFWTYITMEIPSLCCTLYLLYQLLSKQNLRRKLHNHVVIIILLLCLVILVIDNSFYLDGWLTGHGNSFPFSQYICILWWLIDYGFYGAVTIFLVWGSLERHILVFHRHQVLNTKRKIFYLHYLPLILITIYLIGFYVSTILFPPCENVFYNDSLACGSYPCYLDISWLSMWDYLFNGVLCNIWEAVFTISLFVRLVSNRLCLTRHARQRKYRRMAVQLISISSLSLCINLPQSLITLIQNVQPDMSPTVSVVESYLFYFTGYVILLIPIVSLGCSPDLWPKIFSSTERSRRRVVPMAVSTVI